MKLPVYGRVADRSDAAGGRSQNRAAKVEILGGRKFKFFIFRRNPSKLCILIWSPLSFGGRRGAGFRCGSRDQPGRVFPCFSGFGSPRRLRLGTEVPIKGQHVARTFRRLQGLSADCRFAGTSQAKVGVARSPGGGKDFPPLGVAEELARRSCNALGTGINSRHARI